MAFVQSTPLSLTTTTQSTHATTTTCPLNVSMNMQRPLSRRAALSVLASSVVGLAAAAHAVSKTDDDFDLKELKKDAEELSYEEELTDVGPDSREKNPTRVKKKAKEPEYRAEEKQLVESDEQAFETMVEKEKSDSERIKQKFTKGK